MLVIKCKADYRKQNGEGTLLYDETAESDRHHCAVKVLGSADKSMQLD